MSKIVSPIPPFDDEDFTPPPAGACWWRLRLQPNEDGNLLMVRTDATESGSDATWGEWEFFDGHNTILDTGMDRPTCKVRLHSTGFIDWLDILHDGQPTPSPSWRQLTLPGNYRHPEDPS